ncbi:MAG: calcium-binding protein [Paracoccaceae bacterium]
MKKIVLGSLAVAAVAGLAFGVANADSRGAGPMGGMGERPTFQELDSDGDGGITIAEVKARSSARFVETDTNADGKLSADELTAAVAARAAERAGAGMARMIEWRDSDGDGMLSEAEMADNAGSRMFMRLDADDDGTISAEEFAAMQERGRMGRSDGDHERGEHRGEGRRMHGDRG